MDIPRAAFGMRTVVAIALAAVLAPGGDTYANAADVNLASVAKASSSHTSGDTTVDALNDGNEPRSSRDNRRRSYGNWPQQEPQWVEYEWPQEIATNRVAVYWWDDRQGVRAPSSCRLQAWNGSRFVPVEEAEGFGIKRDAFNQTTFKEVKTTRLRLFIDGSPNHENDSVFPTGILEWHVYDSGGSPMFPPRVNAGVDRVVVVGGKTYLDGAVQTLGGDATTVNLWRKASGPGEVAFADAKAAATTASFAAPGEYTLKFTAQDGGLSANDDLTVKVVAAPQGDPLHPVQTGHYRITNPLWKNRVKALIVNWIPHCVERINDHNLREGGINNFEEAAKKLAGQPAERHRGYVFSNAWVHNIVECMCLANMIDSQGDPEILAAQEQYRKTLDDWIPKILAAQEPDGYMQTQFTLSGNPHWSPRYRADHEGYVAGYFLESAIAHYLMTNRQDTRMYEAAKKLADCWCDSIGPSPKKEWFDGHQEMEQALGRFGRFVNVEDGPGKGDKYIHLAKFLLDCRKDGSEYDQSHVPVTQQYEAVGHAVRAVYSYSAMADVAHGTGDRDYMSAIESIWDNIVNRKYYVTGGIGSGETSEGFGPDYSLRNNAYCESCSSCGELYFQHKFNLIRGDAKYADLYEETLYNALLGSVDLEGKNFYYQNPLDGGNPRYPWHACPCCVGNIPRVLMMMPTWTYATGQNALYVNMFFGSEVTVPDVAGTDVEVVQETNYPWEGSVAITVNPIEPKKFAIRLRSPNRDVSELYTGTPEADGITKLTVNGEPLKPQVENGYVTIDREWKTGDKIVFEVPMVAQRVHASDKIEATRGLVALRYGPLMFNFESVDQPLNGALPKDAPLATEWQPELLEGVMVIKTKFDDGTDVTAIPNYARNNRIQQTPRRPPIDGEPAAGANAGDGGGENAGGGRRGRRGGGGRSTVWIREGE